MYSDNQMNAARAFGIAFKVNALTHTGMKLYGIDIEEASGETHRQLPVPSVFLIEAGGRIRWVYSNSDYKIRPDNAQLIEAARRISTNSPTP
ncbi:MAG: peroxiredoxin [Myxococcota bacterium]